MSFWGLDTFIEKKIYLKVQLLQAGLVRLSLVSVGAFGLISVLFKGLANFYIQNSLKTLFFNDNVQNYSFSYESGSQLELTESPNSKHDDNKKEINGPWG